MVRAISDYLFSIADQVVQQAFAACDDTELIIHSFVFTTGGHSLARKHGIPDISVQTFPVFAPTRDIPPVAMPTVPPGLLGYFFHWLFTQVFWHGGNLGFRQLQRADPETFNLDLYWPFTPDATRLMTPYLLACSPTVIPRPDDWYSPHIHIPGYFFLDESDSYHPPDTLTNFLSAGEPPVCVTFGSMIHQDAERIYQTVLAALDKTKNRAIILSGWSDLQNLSSPETILIMEAIPHSWLLPRCKAVIHHGGAGTTAAGLRSGIPNLVVPFASDQPFWGARVHAIGAGPKPIPVKKLSVEKLVWALTEVDEESLRNGAQAAGRKIRAEDGVGAAVKVIEEYIEKWRESPQSAFFKV
jgi:UDP:flavonoid glycosyltransferase YjiC (YdhE family)